MQKGMFGAGAATVKGHNPPPHHRACAHPPAPPRAHARPGRDAAPPAPAVPPPARRSRRAPPSPAAALCNSVVRGRSLTMQRGSGGRRSGLTPARSRTIAPAARNRHKSPAETKVQPLAPSPLPSSHSPRPPYFPAPPLPLWSPILPTPRRRPAPDSVQGGT